MKNILLAPTLALSWLLPTRCVTKYAMPSFATGDGFATHQAEHRTDHHDPSLLLSHRAELYRQLNTTTMASVLGTQRWVGAQSWDVKLRTLQRMECNFTVPSLKTKDLVGGEAHYLYCDMHHNNWDDGDNFHQFVPQLMRGNVVSRSRKKPPYCIQNEMLQEWHIQAQYIWKTGEATPSTCNGRTISGYVGKLVKVDPGDVIRTRIKRTTKGWALLIWVQGDSKKRMSRIFVKAPFMGTHPDYPLSYDEGDHTLSDDYITWSMANLHEAWDMNTADFYPKKNKWKVFYCDNNVACKGSGNLKIPCFEQDYCRYTGNNSPCSDKITNILKSEIYANTAKTLKFVVKSVNTGERQHQNTSVVSEM